VQTIRRATPCSRSPRFRANTPCGGENPSGRFCRRSRNSASGSFLQPSGQGFLTGAISETRPSTAPTSATSFPASRRRPARRIRRWLVCSAKSQPKRRLRPPDRTRLAAGQKPWIVPIPGTTKLHRLDENIGAVAVELTPAELRESTVPSRRSRCKGPGIRNICSNSWGAEAAEPCTQEPALPAGDARVRDAPQRSDRRGERTCELAFWVRA